MLVSEYEKRNPSQAYAASELSVYPRFFFSLAECALFAVSHIFSLLRVFLLPYMLVFASFVVFVKINGGIVVGDRENHQVTLHFPQLLYFFLFFCLFSPAQIMPGIVRWARQGVAAKKDSIFQALLFLLRFALFGLIALYLVRDFRCGSCTRSPKNCVLTKNHC